MDSETKRAWRRLTREVRESTPIVLRGLASEGKQVPRKLYSAVVRGCKIPEQSHQGMGSPTEWRKSAGIPARSRAIALADQQGLND